ncbi:Catalase domain-containing protein [Mycena kentingensis (nom. inval.)]|nr:Catalase domain-containing protein [Mycena kentingensis (nom. inval.)]
MPSSAKLRILRLLPFLLASLNPALAEENSTLPLYTDGAGHPVYSPFDYQRAGARGPLLLQDFHLIDLMSHFDRERIPERVVHAKGSGAHGYFEVTQDISNLTMAAPFSEGVGTQVPLTIRFSTVAGEAGSADTNRDPRGFAIKLRTSAGIWDWVFNNTPIFFLRDPTKFPLFIHSQKRDPQTNLRSPTNQWDYWSHNQESVHQVMRLFSDRGTPKSWTQMDGFSGHTYKFVSATGQWHYVKIKLISQQGLKNFDASEAKALTAENPDYHTQELRERIACKKFPQWKVAIQKMTYEESKQFRYDVFDLTKVWPEDQFPLLEVGKVVLNKNPENWFAEIEQVAFSPGNMPPGVEPSNDPVLQARIFAYSDTARHRLGPNHLQLPINCPFSAEYSQSTPPAFFSPHVSPAASVNNFQRAGPMRVDNGAASLPPFAANYPSSVSPPLRFSARPYNLADIAEPLEGSPVVKASSELTTKDFEQPRELYNKEFSEAERTSLVTNVVAALKDVTVKDVQQRSLDMFACVDEALGSKIAQGLVDMTPSYPLYCGKDM